jgi:GYF domain 2
VTRPGAVSVCAVAGVPRVSLVGWPLFSSRKVHRMTQQWYYLVKGERVGPVSTAHLEKLAAAGELQATDMVWREGLAQWVSAGSINETSVMDRPARDDGEDGNGKSAAAPKLPWYYEFLKTWSLLITAVGVVVFIFQLIFAPAYYASQTKPTSFDALVVIIDLVSAVIFLMAALFTPALVLLLVDIGRSLRAIKQGAKRSVD